MNRRQRRAQSRTAQRVRDLEHRVESTGKPGIIHGLTDACSDCHADGALVLLPGNLVVGHVYHDPGCPAHAGITTWTPVPVN